VVYQWKFARERHDNKAINAMVTKAEKVADGTRPLRRDRFVKVTGGTKGVDWALVDRARQLAGLKGYVTNLPPATMDGAAVIAAYHDLWSRSGRPRRYPYADAQAGRCGGLPTRPAISMAPSRPQRESTAPIASPGWGPQPAVHPGRRCLECLAAPLREWPVDFGTATLAKASDGV
jgi:hypothetical protein